jgi:hypothetical protein
MSGRKLDGNSALGQCDQTRGSVMVIYELSDRSKRVLIEALEMALQASEVRPFKTALNQIGHRREFQVDVRELLRLVQHAPVGTWDAAHESLDS